MLVLAGPALPTRYRGDGGLALAGGAGGAAEAEGSAGASSEAIGTPGSKSEKDVLRR